VAREAVFDADALALRISLDGVAAQATSTRGMVRSAARLIADVSEFMTLRPGDVLMLGVAFGAPRGRANQTFAIDAEGIGRLDGAQWRRRRRAGMRTAIIVAYGGAIRRRRRARRGAGRPGVCSARRRSYGWRRSRSAPSSRSA
jgi:hypothetical protein